MTQETEVQVSEEAEAMVDKVIMRCGDAVILSDTDFPQQANAARLDRDRSVAALLSYIGKLEAVANAARVWGNAPVASEDGKFRKLSPAEIALTDAIAEFDERFAEPSR